MYAGVDWAGNGWFAVVLTDDGEYDAGHYPTLWNLWRQKGDAVTRMLVDIPIGLCADSKRACDCAAKAYLGGTLQSSVFYTPIREAVYADNIEAARESHRKAGTDFGVQNQAWSLVPRIREADVFVETHEESEKILETHPEVCFATLKDGPLSHSKKTDDGIEERLDLLTEATDGDVRGFYETTRSTFRQPAYAPTIGSDDDILDALVAAITAASTEEKLPSLPQKTDPDYDEKLGREIEITIPVVQ